MAIVTNAPLEPRPSPSPSPPPSGACSPAASPSPGRRCSAPRCARSSAAEAAAVKPPDSAEGSRAAVIPPAPRAPATSDPFPVAGSTRRFISQTCAKLKRSLALATACAPCRRPKAASSAGGCSCRCSACRRHSKRCSDCPCPRQQRAYSCPACRAQPRPAPDVVSVTTTVTSVTASNGVTASVTHECHVQSGQCAGQCPGDAECTVHTSTTTTTTSCSTSSATSTDEMGRRHHVFQEQRSLKAAELSQQESQNVSASCVKMHTENFSSEKKAVSAQQQRVVTSGVYNQENMVSSSCSSRSNITIKGGHHTASTVMRTQHLNIQDEELFTDLADLERLSPSSSQQDVDNAIHKYTTQLEHVIKVLRGRSDKRQEPKMLNRINDMIRKAWAVPTLGHELGHTLCTTLRNCGGLELLISNCVAADSDVQYSSALLLEQCLTTENRAHVVENGLEKVVNVACVCTKNANSVDHSRVGTGILEHLFKHSESTCSDVIRLGGLDAVLFECRKNDIETLRHCAGALANLSLYGGADNQEAMIKRKVPMWLFPLAFHNDDNIKYYACLAIAVLVANTEIEAAVLQSGTLDLVEPFVTSHNPSDFARSNLAHAHGQSMHWLRRLVPVLSSKREEARNLAAFHFCMEAGIKEQQGKTDIFGQIGAIEPLKKCASCPNAVASKYAAQALRLIGEEVPHKLSQQVPLWSTEDVREWVKQIGFAEYANSFVESRVDGDLLLQLTEDNLHTDIGIANGIRRKGFTRELQNLKKMADYSSKDVTNLNMFLQAMGPEYSTYTYAMLNAGVDRDSIRCVTEEQLVSECGITNSIHRLKIIDSVRMLENCLDNNFPDNLDKPLDVFVSYRRSNGSQLASLLKVHLQLRGFRVFIDVERLEAGKFDNNLLQSIRQARHFLLVLTPKALERCLGDAECKDWVHKEIVAALQSQCNIIPIIDNFQWPEPEELPEDMRAVCHFNGVRWIHDYQDACVDKLERFMRGELGAQMMREGGPLSSSSRSMLSSKGDATPSTLPGTPSTASIGRHPPTYQRMHSNDSAKGSGSDKDKE